MAHISYDDLKGAKEVEFKVTTGNPYFREQEFSGKKSIILVIPGVTADGRTAEGELWMNNERQDKGPNAGKTRKEIAIQQCYDLGMSEPFSPHKVAELVGKECVFVMKPDVYKNKAGEEKKIARVKYINTFSRPSLSPEKVNDLFKELFDEDFADVQAAASEPAAGDPENADASAGESADGLPF
jgi:hypothetical protein